MIRSWADLQEFLDNGGRLRFAPGANVESAPTWSDAESGGAVASVLATRALAEGKIIAECASESKFEHWGERCQIYKAVA